MENEKIEAKRKEEGLPGDEFLQRKCYADALELYTSFAIIIGRTVRLITPAEIERAFHEALNASWDGK